MNFRSDNASGATPEVMKALAEANHSSPRGYGADDYSLRAETMMRDVLEAPDARVFFVATGTAANALALSALVKPYETIYCHEFAHIEEDEAGAPVFYSGGAKLQHVEAENGILNAEALDSAIHETGAIGVHNWQRGAVSITNITESGALYRATDIAKISAIAKSYHLPLHLDGARFANSVVASGSSAAQMSHQSGVDVLVFGGTKNGLMFGEAVVFFDPEHAWDFEMRRKRGGHLLSKGQYLGAQFEAALINDNWLKWAKNANAKMLEIYNALSGKSNVRFDGKPDANMAYLSFPRAIHIALQKAGASYYLTPATQSLEGAPDEILRARFVTSWATRDEEIAQLLKFFD